MDLHKFEFVRPMYGNRECRLLSACMQFEGLDRQLRCEKLPGSSNVVRFIGLQSHESPDRSRSFIEIEITRDCETAARTRFQSVMSSHVCLASYLAPVAHKVVWNVQFKYVVFTAEQLTLPQRTRSRLPAKVRARGSARLRGWDCRCV